MTSPYRDLRCAWNYKPMRSSVRPVDFGQFRSQGMPMPSTDLAREVVSEIYLECEQERLDSEGLAKKALKEEDNSPQFDQDKNQDVGHKYSSDSVDIVKKEVQEVKDGS